jgi:hypothetical protein
MIKLALVISILAGSLTAGAAPDNVAAFKAGGACPRAINGPRPTRSTLDVWDRLTDSATLPVEYKYKFLTETLQTMANATGNIFDSLARPKGRTKLAIDMFDLITDYDYFDRNPSMQTSVLVDRVERFNDFTSIAEEIYEDAVANAKLSPELGSGLAGTIEKVLSKDEVALESGTYRRLTARPRADLMALLTELRK